MSYYPDDFVTDDGEYIDANDVLDYVDSNRQWFLDKMGVEDVSGDNYKREQVRKEIEVKHTVLIHKAQKIMNNIEKCDSEKDKEIIVGLYKLLECFL